MFIASHCCSPPRSAGPPAPPRPRPLKVVASLPTYGAIAREIVGDRATVTAIAQGDEDPHFVQPKPSFVALLRDADLFVTTGLDLELWVPALLDRAGNRKVQEGGPGLRRRLPGHHAARGAHLAEPLGGRHPRGRQPAHPHRSAQRRSSSPATSSPGCSGSRPATRPYFAAAGAGLRAAGAGGDHGRRSWCRSSRRPPRSACSRATSSTTSSASRSTRASRWSTGWAAGSSRRRCSAARRWPATTRSGPTSATASR